MIPKNQVLLLITGTHSSGKSWLSKALKASLSVSFVHEPLNPLSPPGLLPSSDRSFWRRVEPKSDDAKRFYGRLLGRYLPAMRKVDGVLSFASLLKSSRQRRKQFEKADVVCVKDPFSAFSVDVYDSHPNLKVLFLFRSPQSFVANAMSLGLSFSLNRFDLDKKIRESNASTNALYERMGEKLQEAGGDLCLQNIAYFSLVYHYISRNFQNLSSTRFLSLESINLDPKKALQRIAEWIGKNLSDAQAEHALEEASQKDISDKIIMNESDLKRWTNNDTTQILNSEQLELISAECGSLYRTLLEREHSSW